MRWMTLRDSNDRGAVAIIVVVLFGFGVMLSAAALTIDVGNINAERRQLQNGSDSVALAVAKQCNSAAGCPAQADPFWADLKTTLANKNAADGYAKIRRVDAQTPWNTATAAGGSTPTGTQAVCGVAPNLYFCPTTWTSTTGNLQECPAWTGSTASTKHVRVYTQTESANATHDTLLPYSFGAAIAGAGSGSNQQTCSAVAWGPGYVPELTEAVTDDICAWNAATSNTPAFPAMPPYASAPNTSPLGAVPVDAKYVVKVLIQGNNGPTSPASCGKINGASGQYDSGTFGWLKVKAGTNCVADIDVTGTPVTVDGDTGASPPARCDTELAGKVGTVIYLPIFSSTTGNGSGAKFILEGVSAFFLAGFQAPSATTKNAYKTDNLTDYNYCLDGNVPHGPNKDNGCLWGWFVSPKLDAGSFGGQALGPTLTKVVG